MKGVFLFYLILMSSFGFSSVEIISEIHDIDLGNQNESPIIFLTSGHAVRIASHQKKLLHKLRIGLQSKHLFAVTIDNNIITKIKTVKPPSPPPANKEKDFIENIPYRPSIIKSLDEATRHFNESRKNAKPESQCFNRSHVWTYDWRINNNLYSSKAWIFFTRKYIRKYKFEWWFHVAPMVHVAFDDVVKERIMDIKYSKGPISLKGWTDIFMRDNSNCPVVVNYSDYTDFQESSSCFVMKSSMYYYQPLDLEEFEMTTTPKTKWIQQEVQEAYSEAFDITI